MGGSRATPGLGLYSAQPVRLARSKWCVNSNVRFLQNLAANSQPKRKHGKDIPAWLGSLRGPVQVLEHATETLRDKGEPVWGVSVFLIDFKLDPHVVLGLMQLPQAR